MPHLFLFGLDLIEKRNNGTFDYEFLNVKIYILEVLIKQLEVASENSKLKFSEKRIIFTAKVYFCYFPYFFHNESKLSYGVYEKSTAVLT